MTEGQNGLEDDKTTKVKTPVNIILPVNSKRREQEDVKYAEESINKIPDTITYQEINILDKEAIRREGFYLSLIHI